MSGRAMNNSKSITRIDSFCGKCSRFGENATVTVRSVGRIFAKTDLQRTYHIASIECSLLERTNEANFSSCTTCCPLIPQKFL